MPQVYDVTQRRSALAKPVRNKRLIWLLYGVIGLSLFGFVVNNWIGDLYFNPDIIESEQTFSNSLVTVYSAKRPFVLGSNHRGSAGSVLVLVSVKDANSWGSGRTGNSFLSLVSTFEYAKHKLSIGILTSDKDEYLALKRNVHDSFNNLGFASVTVMHSLKSSKEAGADVDRGYRKADDVQRERRRTIARNRNLLLYSTLEVWHDGVLWLDSDIVQVPSYLLRKMVDSGLDIVHPACYFLGQDGGGDYDRNAWRGPRLRPNEDEREQIAHGGLFVPRPGPGTKFMSDLANEQDDIVELDSVGGTMLYVRAEIHRTGVAFTTNYIIGAGWDHEGYDGIESESLCYIARFLGYKCWGMPKERIFHARDY